MNLIVGCFIKGTFVIFQVHNRIDYWCQTSNNRFPHFHIINIGHIRTTFSSTARDIFALCILFDLFSTYISFFLWGFLFYLLFLSLYCFWFFAVLFYSLHYFNPNIPFIKYCFSNTLYFSHEVFCNSIGYRHFKIMFFIGRHIVYEHTFSSMCMHNVQLYGIDYRFRNVIYFIKIMIVLECIQNFSSTIESFFFHKYRIKYYSKKIKKILKNQQTKKY